MYIADEQREFFQVCTIWLLHIRIHNKQGFFWILQMIFPYKCIQS